MSKTFASPAAKRVMGSLMTCPKLTWRPIKLNTLPHLEIQTSKSSSAVNTREFLVTLVFSSVLTVESGRIRRYMPLNLEVFGSSSLHEPERNVDDIVSDEDGRSSQIFTACTNPFGSTIVNECTKVVLHSKRNGLDIRQGSCIVHTQRNCIRSQSQTVCVAVVGD